MRYTSGSFSGLFLTASLIRLVSIDQSHILIQEHFLTSYFQDAFLDYFYIKWLNYIGIFCIFPAPLPSHAHYQMRHGEPEEHEAEEGGQCSAGRDNPEGGQERKLLGGEAFAGGGDEGRDGVPFCK
jgi:hypothetical protein